MPRTLYITNKPKRRTLMLLVKSFRAVTEYIYAQREFRNSIILLIYQTLLFIRRQHRSRVSAFTQLQDRLLSLRWTEPNKVTLRPFCFTLPLSVVLKIQRSGYHLMNLFLNNKAVVMIRVFNTPKFKTQKHYVHMYMYAD
jgi:hypothetical protein